MTNFVQSFLLALKPAFSWVHQQHLAVKDSGRIVLIEDHTKTPQDGRCIPAVTTLHQDSETAGKPSFFRGHEWGCITLLMAAGSKIFATPLSARIHNDSIESGSRIQRLVAMAGHATEQMQTHAYLVLDAFFSVGSTFEEADRWNGRIHILTRAKKNITAYIPAEKCWERKPGRLRIYGPKLKLMDLFDQWKTMFLTDTLPVYGKQEIVSSSRRPRKGKQSTPISTHPAQTQKTLSAIEKFVTLHLVIIGFLQSLVLRFPNQIRQKALCWLRTDRSEIPSEFVTKTALANLIQSNLDTSGDDLITHFIQNKRKNIENTGLRRKDA